MDAERLRSRSSRTLAWLGDAVFEREVRLRVASRGDYPTDRLDAIKSEVVRAEAQAALYEAIEPLLAESERSVARRARNATPPAGKPRRGTQEYRLATGLEALVAHWALGGDGGWARFEALLSDALETAIDRAVARRARRPRRG